MARHMSQEQEKIEAVLQKYGEKLSDVMVDNTRSIDLEHDRIIESMCRDIIVEVYSAGLKEGFNRKSLSGSN